MIRFLLALAAALSMTTPAFASSADDQREAAADSRAAEILQVMAGELAADQVFAPTFLKAVPAAQLEKLTTELVAQNGALVTIDDLTYSGSGAAKFDLVFERGRAAAMLQLDGRAPFLVIGFRINAVTPIDDTPQKILQDFTALPGRATFGVYKLDKDGVHSVLTNQAHEQLAIGSTFKLYVLSALARQVRQGKRHWDDVTRIDAHSLPSGQLQTWPIGTPVTLQALATMMISISDNTATDVLMRLLGRKAIAEEVIASGHSDPGRTLPLLATVEAFALKQGDPARIEAYSAADEPARAALLDRWKAELTSNSIDLGKLLDRTPDAIDKIEWFASNEDLAKIFLRLRDSGDPVVLDILAVNPSIAPDEAEAWAYAGYKGGSEAGVLNLSWLLRDRQQRWFVVSASWNNPGGPVDETTLGLLTMRLRAMIRQ